ncbi:MAG TPA: IclR family transcriptional regulator [Capsulimonadaceae bacterium]|jgi:DNA-binding IclR family transcriptional regulator
MPIVSSLDKSIDILEAVFAAPGGVGTRGLAKKLDLNVATVHNVAMTYCGRGYLRQDSVTKKFHPGIRFAILVGHPDVSPTLLPLVASPIIEETAARLNESVMLAIIDQRRIINLKYVSSQQALRVHEPDDVTGISHCTAVGKLLLASLGPTELDSYLSETSFESYTPRTITEPAALRSEIEAIRSNGYARSIDELAEGVSAIAVPIFSPWGSILAGVGASAPTLRLQEQEQIDESLLELRRAASAIGLAWSGRSAVAEK